MRVRYVSSDHTHPRWRQEGEVLVRSGAAGEHTEPQVPRANVARRGGPRNELVRFDDGTLVVAPYGNLRLAL